MIVYCIYLDYIIILSYELIECHRLALEDTAASDSNPLPVSYFSPLFLDIWTKVKILLFPYIFRVKHGVINTVYGV